MPRRPKPWWNAQKQSWYAQVDHRKVRIGSHPEGAPKPKKGKQGWNAPRSIVESLNRVLDGGETEREVVDQALVGVILNRFLEWAKNNRKEGTYRGYRRFLKSFHSTHTRIKTRELKPWHVHEWVSGQPTWNNTTRRDAITALKRALNWAAEMEYISVNPIANMKKPAANTRSDTVSLVEFNAILEANTVPQFEDLIIVSYDCGCRPQEVKPLQARHVQLDQQRWVLPTEEAKGKRSARTVYIPTKRSLEILRRLVSERPDGYLFRNSRGTMWTGDAVMARFRTIEKVLGRRFRQYDLRHTFATNKLKAGVDSHVVAKLMGHSDTSMIDRVYSHVTHDPEYMLEQAQKGVTEDDRESEPEREVGGEPPSGPLDRGDET